MAVPEGRVRAGGAERGRQDHAAAAARRAGQAAGGKASVLGGAPRQDPAFLAGIGFLAQEIPLYRRFTAEDHIRIGAHLNPRWDAVLARTRLEELRIPLDQRVGTLSGGQRAQVALALTLAKRPGLLLQTSHSRGWTRWRGGLPRDAGLGHGRGGGRPHRRVVLAPG